MNRFVGYYIEARMKDKSLFNRQLIFASIVQTIAKCGTMQDLKALTTYYQNEMEELSNESIARTISAS